MGRHQSHPKKEELAPPPEKKNGEGRKSCDEKDEEKSCLPFLSICFKIKKEGGGKKGPFHLLGFFPVSWGLIWGASGEEGVRREGGLAIKIARQNVKRGRG